MKKFVCLLALFFIFVSFAIAQRRTDRETEGLQGSVKSIRLERSQVKRRDGRDIEGARTLGSVINYDEQGNRTEELSYNFINGTLEERKVFSRDADGNQTVIAYGATGAIISKSVTNFNQAGRITGSVTYDANGAVIRKSVTNYDAAGRFIESAMYNGDGSLSNRTVYLHDAQGRPAGYEVYDASGAMMMKVTQTADGYDAALYNNDGTVHHRTTGHAPTEEYDSHGNWIKRSMPQSNPTVGRTEETISVEYRTITYY